MKENFKNAGIYPRVSSQKQVREGFSLEFQKENLARFVNDHGWNLYDNYADEGISAKNVKDRPGVKRLIEDIRNEKVQIVVLYRFDRLTRDSRDTEDFIELMQAYDVEVYTLSGGAIDVNTPSGRFATRVQGAAAQFERESIIERVKAGFKQKAKTGYTNCSATTCYGYNRKNHENKMTINRKEAIVVKRIFNMYLNGNSFSEICDVLNSEKIPTKLAGKTRKIRGTNKYTIIRTLWTPKTIRLILSNPTYIGKIRYHINAKDYQEFEGCHNKIISLDIFNKANEKLKKIKKKSRTNLPKEDVYYCGTLVCGICGHKLTTQRTVKTKKDGTKTTFLNYRCINREKKVCSCAGVSHKKIEKAFINYLAKIKAFDQINNINFKNENLKELETLKKILMQYNSKHKEVMNLFMANKINYEQLQYMTNTLEKKQDSLKQKINLLKQNAKQKIDKDKIAKTLKEHWFYLSNREKLEFLTNFIEEIIVINNNKKNSLPEITIKFYK